MHLARAAPRVAGRVAAAAAQSAAAAQPAQDVARLAAVAVLGGLLPGPRAAQER